VRREPLTDTLLAFLLTGERHAPITSPEGYEVYLLHGAVLHGRFDTVAAIWAEHREQILAAWTTPSARPAAWWWCEAPEPRLLLDGAEMQMAPCVLADTLWRRRLGVPALRVQVRRAGHPAVTVESEASYLRRLGLLARDEERRLAPEAFEPARVFYDYEDHQEEETP
jgi:hypothetical protein